MRNIVIIGGGITGLSAAFYLQQESKRKQEPIKLKLIEASERLGGKIKTMKRDGFTIEQGPDSLLSRKPAIVELTKELGLEDEMIFNEAGSSFILVDGKLHPMPAGTFMGVPKEEKAIVDTEIFTEAGKKRALEELEIPKGEPVEDQSLGLFMRRRFGDEAVNRLIAPMLAGIHSGDIDAMSLMAIYPLFYELEQKYGSVMKGLQEHMPNKPVTTEKRSSGIFFTFKDGLETLVHQLHEKLAADTVSTGVAAEQIVKTDFGYEIYLESGEKLAAEAVILATEHSAVPNLFCDHPFLQELKQIPAVSTANVVMAFDGDAIENDLDGTGFQVAREGDIEITACTWTNKKWPSTTPENKVLLRVYVGSPEKQAFMKLSDEVLTELVLDELKKVMTIKADPQFTVVTRWKDARPQYQVGHRKFIQRIRDELSTQLPGIQIIGSSYDGAGIPDCVANGKKAALEALQFLKNN